MLWTAAIITSIFMNQPGFHSSCHLHVLPQLTQKRPNHLRTFQCLWRICRVPWQCEIAKTRFKRGHHSSGQIITTSAEVTLNGGLVRESTKNPLNSGLGIILICPDGYTPKVYQFASQKWWDWKTIRLPFWGFGQFSCTFAVKLPGANPIVSILLF